MGEESGVKCDRLAQHVLATEGRPVPSATMEDFLPSPSFSPVPSSAGLPVNPALRSSSRPVGHFRAIASPSALVCGTRLSARLGSPRLSRLDLARLGSDSPRLASPRLVRLSRSPSYLPSYLSTYLPTMRSYHSAENRRENHEGPSASVTVVERIPIV